MATLRQLLLRRKQLDTSPSNLVRKLGLLDLTLLGMGATLGAGAYVLVGVVARNHSGPAIAISFLISGLASILSALCYAEFGARVPRAGSAYVYSYVTVGEVLAWTTGWQLLLEYIIGASSVARAWSGYLDLLANNSISTWLNARVGGWGVPGLASYPDFLSFGMTMLLTLVCAAGVRESTMINNVLTATNVVVILFVIFAGLAYVNPANYSPFAPNGVKGIVDGAATAFYSYVGFDVIATSAEETINPSRNIPIAIILSLSICMVVYMAVACVITLMVPYNTIDPTSPLAAAFGAHGANWAKLIIAVGAVCGLSTSLMTSIFPMPRIVYAIAEDGLLPRWLGAVHPRFNTPIWATLLCGLLAGCLALIFDLNALADMMSIGTLLSYTLVAASVLVLRYRQYDEECTAANLSQAAASSLAGDSAPLLRPEGSSGLAFHFLPRVPAAGTVVMWHYRFTSYAAAAWSLFIYVLGAIFLCVGAMSLQNFAPPPAAAAGIYAMMAIGGLLLTYGAACLFALPRVTPTNLSFVTPLAPQLPLLSVLVNVYLLVSLSYETWIRFAVWCLIGTAIYLGYGMRNSRTPVTDGAFGASKFVAPEATSAPAGYAPVPEDVPGKQL